MYFTRFCRRSCIANVRPFGAVLALTLSLTPFARAESTDANAPASNWVVEISGERMSVADAKAFLSAHEADLAELEKARREVLKKGAKVSDAERAKLIQRFRVAQQERLDRVRKNTGRAAALADALRGADGQNASKPTK